VFGESKGDFKGTVANLRSATGAMSEAMPGVMFKVNGILNDVGEATSSAKAAMEDIRKTAEHAKDLTGAAKSVLVGNKSKLDSMISSLDKTASNLKNGTADVLRNPWKILYKPTADDRANAELFNSARQFSEGAGDLRDAAQALSDAMKDKQVSGRRLDALMLHLEKTFNRYSEVEKQLWNSVRE
jgi:ABC-type transporter Mla subunit MlaD